MYTGYALPAADRNLTPTTEIRQRDLAQSDRGWMSGVAGDDVVTSGDPRLKAETDAVDDEQSGITETGWEGCFSVPGFIGLVPRAETITVEYISAEGIDVVEWYSGYLARVIQHEIDHLNGVEFVDRMEPMESLTTVKNYLDFHR